jgi:hypothetical protein
MYCEDAIRKLAVPSDERDPQALAEHLAACPSCARWAERAALLDRLWQATSPGEPDAHTWDQVWAGVAGALGRTRWDSEASGRVATSIQPNPASGVAHRHAHRQWIWPAIGLIGVAQAAAVLLVVGLARRSEAVNIEEGHVVVIRPATGAGLRVVDLAPAGMSYGVDDWYEMFNTVEWIADPVVAMKE